MKFLARWYKGAASWQNHVQQLPGKRAGAAGTGRLREVPGELGELSLSAGLQQVYFLYPVYMDCHNYRIKSSCIKTLWPYPREAGIFLQTQPSALIKG